MERDILLELLRLLSELDEEDFNFSSEISARSVESNRRSRLGKRPSQSRRPGQSPTPARTSRNIDQNERKTGTEKFRARRNVKKLNRLLKKAEREGIPVESLFGSKQVNPLIRAVIDEDESVATIFVDHQNAKISRRDRSQTVTVAVDDYKESIELSFEPSVIERMEKPGTTIFTVSSEQR